jgi:periplasmic protein CpxP/Spy
MIVRALASVLLASSIVLAAAAALAQDTNAGAAPSGQTAPSQAVDPTAARIKYLHDRLRITAEQEDLWDRVGQAIRDNSQNLAPLLKERRRAATSGSAPEVLHAYEALGEAQLDSQRKIVTVFEPLYASLSESQKKIADAIIREGAQSAMSFPLVPPPFTSALAFPSVAYPSVVYPSVSYPPLWSESGVPVAAPYPLGVHHFHGFIRPHAHSGRFHHR